MSCNRDGFRGENDPAGAVSPYVNQRGVQPNGGMGSAPPSAPYIYLQDPDVTIHCGNALDVLRELPDESVHMCCTSPPFYGLRDYGTGSWEGGDPDCDHLQKVGGTGASTLGAASGGNDMSDEARQRSTERSFVAYAGTCGKCGATRVDQQIGLEPTPDEWVAALVGVFREVRRVLRKDGTCWIEIGDSYCSNPGDAAKKGDAHSYRDRKQWFPPKPGASIKPKDLIGAPWLLAFALRADGWFLRSEIIWAKPNPMPESVTDRPTTSHSRVFLLAKTKDYYYDQEAVREPMQPDSEARYAYSFGGPKSIALAEADRNGMGVRTRPIGDREPTNGRNRRSVWTIPTEPYPEAHFATWPTRLVEPMILAGASERGVCPGCGAPWERVTESEQVSTGRTTNGPRPRTDHIRAFDGHSHKSTSTVGWQPTCKCKCRSDICVGPQHPCPTCPDGTVPATVLDPFGGSGTTAHVARKHGRRSILIELNETYCELAARRLAQQSLEFA